MGLSMDPHLDGSLGESLPDLIREIARRGASGALRLSRDNTARSIYFDSGTPVSITSERADEQFESRLLKEGRTTAGLIQAAQSARPSSSLSRALIDNGVLSEDAVRLTTGELVKQIALSIFDGEAGEYEFEEGARPAKAAALDCTPADLIKAARQAVAKERLASAIAPPDLLVAPADTSNYFLASLPALNSVESYVLSRIDAPVRVNDVSDFLGLPGEDTHRAVCVLVALGLLARVGYAVADAASRSVPDPLLSAVSRKLQLFESADYYAVLGVDVCATAGAVAQAFDDFQRMFNSYRSLSSDSKELHAKLDALFARVAEAYETLSDPVKRWAYDKRAGMASSGQPSGPLARDHAGVQSAINSRSSFDSTTGLNASADKVFTFSSMIERGEPQAPRSAATPPTEPLPRAATGSKLPGRAPIPGLSSLPIELPVAPPGAGLGGDASSPVADQPQWVTASQTALRNYTQGRTRYEQKDVTAAHHLFREACRLDPSQSHYHFYLAMTLIILSQARREHAHHEGCHVTCSIGGTLVSNPRMRYDAEQHLLKAAELDPINPQIPLRLALLFKEAGLTNKAEHYFRETLLRDGKNKTALFELELLEQAGAPEQTDSNESSVED
ncbi:MAG TPA: DUF4388 domain-containing protein [Blastocatellia bacterium]|nr:DUF4388 domain-containing protein [Blastocatellia bacterium]